MTEQPKRGPGSKILRDRAMAVLRDTRAKMDPQFLAAMREHFSMLMPSGFAKPPEDENTPPSFADALNEHNKKEKGTELKPAPSYPVQSFDNLAPLEPEKNSGSEPVDQQKIAKIVLEYMKNRQNGQRH